MLSPIDRYFDRFDRFELIQLVTEIPLFVRPVYFFIIIIIISLALKKRGQFVLDSTAAHQGLATPMCVLPLFLSFPSHLSAFANYHHYVQ